MIKIGDIFLKKVHNAGCGFCLMPAQSKKQSNKNPNPSNKN